MGLNKSYEIETKQKKNHVLIQIKANAPFDINPITLMSQGVLLWCQREVQLLTCQLN